MELIKGQKSEWGDFEIIPSDEWKISESYIDFGSGLLIISERPSDLSRLSQSEYGMTIIPNKTYVIQKDESKILSPEEWRAYFNYDLNEFTAENGKFRIVEQRIPSSKGNFDYIESKLIEVESGNVLQQASSVGFSAKKRPNIYERYKEQKEAEKRKKDQEKSKLTLEHFYHHEFLRLQFNHTILTYTDEDDICYRAKIGDSKNVLLEEGGKKPLAGQDIKLWKSYKKFDSVELFWNWLNNDTKWYQKFRPYWIAGNRKVENSILAYYIIHEANKIRYTTNLNKYLWTAIRAWENLMDLNMLSQSELIQVCPNCMAKMMFFPMFPTLICGNCESQLTDINGRRVSFSNISMSGGCQGYYTGTDEKYNEYIFYIGENKFYADEMKFGGIAVIPYDDRQNG